MLLGCEQFGTIESEWAPIACVAENLLQRGMPTHPSQRLAGLLGDRIKLDIDRPARRLITHDHMWAKYLILKQRLRIACRLKGTIMRY